MGIKKKNKKKRWLLANAICVVLFIVAVTFFSLDVNAEEQTSEGYYASWEYQIDTSLAICLGIDKYAACVENEHFLFFHKDDAIFRMNIETQEIEEFVKVSDCVDVVDIVAYSDTYIVYYVFTGEFEYDEDDDGLWPVYKKYKYDSETGCCEEVTDEEDSDETMVTIFEGLELEKIGSFDVGAVGIQSVASGSDIPFEGYGIGKYFSITGKACVCHKEGKCVEDGGNCTCYRYGNAVQCLGYARYAYFLFHGEPEIDAAKVFVQCESRTFDWENVPEGTHIRLNYSPGDKDGRHSVFVKEKYDDGLLIYQANVGKPCYVSEARYSWDELRARYYWIKYISNPEFIHRCTPGDTYVGDGEKHWLICVECGEKCDVETHTWGEWTKNGAGHSRKCLICQKDSVIETHKIENGYRTNSNVHWKECSLCHAAVESAGHERKCKELNENSHTVYCAVCDYEIGTAEHILSGYKTDSVGHWRVCTQCNYSTQKMNHRAGEKNDIGTKQHNVSCADCGMIYTSESHSYKYTRGQNGKHTAQCDCGYSYTASHTYVSNGNTSTSHTKKCKYCGDSITESHSYKTEQLDGTNHCKTCTVCGYRINQKHSMRVTSVTKVKTASMCTVTVETCSACGYAKVTKDSIHRYSGKTCLDCGYVKK